MSYEIDLKEQSLAKLLDMKYDLESKKLIMDQFNKEKLLVHIQDRTNSVCNLEKCLEQEIC